MKQEVMIPEVITSQRKKECLESGLFALGQGNPFYSGLLQEINIRFNDQCPTVGLMYNKKKQEFHIDINSQFFCKFNLVERSAILFHEILHFSHKHVFRIEGGKDKISMLDNIAKDMAINQFILGLPKGCVDVKNFKDKLGVAFPLYRTSEDYYQLLEQNQESNKEELEKFQPMDQHLWEDLSDEEYQKMLEEAKKLVERTVEKSAYGHNIVPDSIKDLLKEIEQKVKDIDYKTILKKAVKKSICVTDRESTWNRPNKRYGTYSPGTRVGKLPMLSIYGDTSGSISHIELNQFMEVIFGFLKSGHKNCWLGLWHQKLYSKKKFKFNEKIDQNILESGGTDIKDVMEDIKKTKPNLAIILTDGYFDEYSIKMETQDVIWVISENGNPNHPMEKLGKTIKLGALLKND